MIINPAGNSFALPFLNRIERERQTENFLYLFCLLSWMSLFLKVIHDIITMTVLFLACTSKTEKGIIMLFVTIYSQEHFPSLQRLGFVFLKRTGAEESFVLSHWALFQLNFCFLLGVKKETRKKETNYFQWLLSVIKKQRLKDITLLNCNWGNKNKSPLLLARQVRTFYYQHTHEDTLLHMYGNQLLLLSQGLQMPSEEIGMGLKKRRPEANSNLKKVMKRKEGKRDVQESLKSANRGRGQGNVLCLQNYTLYHFWSLSGDLLQYMPDCILYI